MVGSVSANVLEVYNLGKYGRGASAADILMSACGQLDILAKDLQRDTFMGTELSALVVI